MSDIEKREKKYFYAACVLYISGFILGSDHITLAVLSFCASAVSGLGTISAEKGKDARNQVYILIIVFTFSAFIYLWEAYKTSSEIRGFESYRSEHQCEKIGNTITGYSNGACDRFGNCEEGHENIEPEYFCTLTRKHITFSDFKVGHYGR